jgi:predicted transcriptional regulator
MLTDVSAVRAYFAKLGLEQEIADIYLALYSNGPQTISSLSRTAGIERTRIYRLIDKLLDSNLVELETQHKRGLIKAAPISNLRILINQREQELKNLTDELELMEQVLSRNSLSLGDTRIQFFAGPEGVRQMLKRELQSQGKISGYNSIDLQAIVGKKYWENHLAELKKRDIVPRFFSEPPANTTHTCHVYDDTVAYIFTDGQVYGLELQDARIASVTLHLER